MSVSVPTILALAGTALMAIAIFFPFRSSSERHDAVDERSDQPRWPELVEPSATLCDVAARLDLVDALESIGSPWALDVLRHASEEEPDPVVLAAIDAALAATARSSAPSASSSQSLVT